MDDRILPHQTRHSTRCDGGDLDAPGGIYPVACEDPDRPNVPLTDRREISRANVIAHGAIARLRLVVRKARRVRAG